MLSEIPRLILEELKTVKSLQEMVFKYIAHEEEMFFWHNFEKTMKTKWKKPLKSSRKINKVKISSVAAPLMTSVQTREYLRHD